MYVHTPLPLDLYSSTTPTLYLCCSTLYLSSLCRSAALLPLYLLYCSLSQEMRRQNNKNNNGGGSGGAPQNAEMKR